MADAVVSAASLLTADAAISARRGRAKAGRAADDLVAARAARDATLAEFRAEAAAMRIRHAAVGAALTVLESEPDPMGPEALLRASEVAATVQAAAKAVAEETAALALSVASAVEMTAKLVAATRRALDRAIDTEVAATAAALELRELQQLQ